MSKTELLNRLIALEQLVQEQHTSVDERLANVEEQLKDLVKTLKESGK